MGGNCYNFVRNSKESKENYGTLGYFIFLGAGGGAEANS